MCVVSLAYASVLFWIDFGIVKTIIIKGKCFMHIQNRIIIDRSHKMCLSAFSFISWININHQSKAICYSFTKKIVKNFFYILYLNQLQNGVILSTKLLNSRFFNRSLGAIAITYYLHTIHFSTRWNFQKDNHSVLFHFYTIYYLIFLIKFIKFWR